MSLRFCVSFATNSHNDSLFSHAVIAAVITARTKRLSLYLVQEKTSPIGEVRSLYYLQIEYRMLLKFLSVILIIVLLSPILLDPVGNNKLTRYRSSLL